MDKGAASYYKLWALGHKAPRFVEVLYRTVRTVDASRRDIYVCYEYRRLEISATVKRGRVVGLFATHTEPQQKMMQARPVLKEELQRLGLKPNELRLRHKGDEAKVRVAAELRSQTTMTLAWIAQGLAMGSGGYVANCVRTLTKE